ncbi:unnamed protein product [Malus baccata var. baccata]
MVQSNPLIKPKEIISNLKQFYGLDIDYSTTYFGKQWAVYELNGDDVDAYKFLPWYVKSAHSSTLGSVVELEVVLKSNRFLRLFIAYDGWIKGFMFCRPMLFMDGTFIKSKYKGTLLSCCAKYGNDESFNAMVSNSHCMPLLDLLDDIRVRLMGSMAEKRIFGQNIHMTLCPKKENEMKLMLKQGMHWRIGRSDAVVFQVLQHDNHDVFYYVDDYRKASFYLKTYQFVMHPFLDLEMPNVDTIINGVRPPITKISSRRPKQTRIKSAGKINGSHQVVKKAHLLNPDVVYFLKAQDVEDEYSRAMSSKNKGKGKDREKV